MGTTTNFILFLVFGGITSSVFATDCFYDNIKSLAPSDAKLYSRHDKKHTLIAKNTSKVDYLKIMENIKSSGTTFACGYTRGWIAEILQGLSSQYDEFKIKSKSGWPAAGYQNVTGSKVIDLFDSYIGSAKRILYKFQIVGPLDHVWMVEQLANGAGYRVYQSYNNAYSLKAWLANGDLKSMHGTDIIIWHDVIRMADGFLKNYGASMSNLDNLPAPLQPMKPWLVFIRDYNLTQVEEGLRKAWSIVGQGRIMPKDYFYKNYLEVLANLTESIIPFVSTQKLWTKELHDKWTSLFGAPNPVLFPGYPFDTLTKQYSQNYALEVKPVVIDSAMEGNCAANARFLSNSLIDCFYDNVKRLSVHDKLLNSRLDEKTLLIKSGKIENEFLKIMRYIKSSGKAFACGFTRSWIAEILQGLSSQYQELKIKDKEGTTKAGFVNVTGQKVVDLFNSNLGSEYRILYKFQIVGPLDHVWMVEQLSYGGGYRVYQSYNNAYSLKAWLAKGDLKSMYGTDIIIWHDVIRMADGFLKNYGASMSNLDNLPAPLQPMKPWLVFIRDYNLTQVEEGLRKAWSVVGQGRIMPKDYFYKNYLEVLANLTESIIPFVSTQKLWTKELHDKWTSLFGAPNPVLFPGYPFDTLTKQYSQNYALEVKTLVINSTMEGYCAANARFLSNSLIDCFFDTVKKLSYFDTLLNSRLEEKKKLISQGKSKDDWLYIMNTIKSSGKTFSCGYTRSWISEILQGLHQQYSELVSRNNSGTAAAGFNNVTGSKVVDLFTRNLGSEKRILYKFQIVGPLDHVWLVEQLPFGGGYRVYQSYNNAYSLMAWLATGDLKSMYGTDIIIWHDVVKMASNYLKLHGGSMSNLDNLPVAVCAMKPWLVYIRDYNLTQVDENLKLAWKNFGQGQICSKDFFFSNYLYVLGNLTEAILPFVNTPKKWTQKLHDQWTSLFGSPNPVLYPGFAFNQLTAQFSQKYALEVKALAIEKSLMPNDNVMDEGNCQPNGAILQKSLECFFDAVKELAPFENKLMSRYLEKTKILEKGGVNQSEFVRTMTQYKSPSSASMNQSVPFRFYWTEEIVNGLTAQYEELKNGSNSVHAKNLTGQNLLETFNANVGSRTRILYSFRVFCGDRFSWLVEQLPFGKGYRVFQSSQFTFSLNAWLEFRQMSVLSKSDIFAWKNTISKANNYLKKYGASISNLSAVPASQKQWITYIGDYNETMAKSDFSKSWKMFGKGEILSKDLFYKNYLQPLSKLLDGVIPLADTSKPWTKELSDQWIYLFGAPNPWMYPGLPVNTYSNSRFTFVVNIVKSNTQDEAECPARVEVLRQSVGDKQITPTTTTTAYTGARTTSRSTTKKPVDPGDAAAKVQPVSFLATFAVLIFIVLLL